MHLQLSRLVLSLGALTFVAAHTESFSDLRKVLEFEYRPKHQSSHLKYINYYGRGPIDDYDSMVVTYVDEEYRDSLQKKVESETAGINEMRFLLLRDIKVGDSFGKSMRELEEWNKQRKEEWEKQNPDMAFDKLIGAYRPRKDIVYDTSETFGAAKTLVNSIASALEWLKQCVSTVTQTITRIKLVKTAIGRNAGFIYQGAIYTINVNGDVWRVATLPRAYGNDYDPTTAPDITELIDHCLDGEMKTIASGLICTTDHNNNWQPTIYLQKEDVNLLLWGYIAVEKRG